MDADAPNPAPPPPQVAAAADELGAALAEVQARLRALLLGGPVAQALDGAQRELVRRVEAELARAQEQLGRLGSPGGGWGAANEGGLLAAVPEAGADSHKGRFRVLYVDDDRESRDGVGELLARYFDVHLAPDGVRAAELARALRPDIIVTDLNMPGLDGLSLLSLLRSDEDTAHIPLLVVSASTHTEAKVLCFEAGASDYLTKPVVADELVARVRNALARSEDLRRERALQATDDLTGLANRRRLRSFLTPALRSAARTRTELTVVMVDQDRLKELNDRFGHAAGDQALRALAQALSACKRSGDLAARIGGDEFVVSMPDTDRAGAGRFVARVEEELRLRPILLEQGEVYLSASFGLASASERDWEESAEHLLQRADRALYEAKRLRRSRPTD
ncbi:diguanylate cyclase [Aggregicoccus sp. 17bor-14]|uniref:GGDEF domain-containing protein n=1 Tax=Myxococcaceae TaxID=31 RepID=UPI00129CB3E9|nr:MULTISPECIES: diguanylate cyclase [Myxococcaceae]MBF5041306.1 diguanylate cyclase [Simulacricoccus sp. 17bor-14]MRI87092.1 diguanylate cyclase [Aggregicoccus sp. 17bor-14]